MFNSYAVCLCISSSRNGIGAASWRWQRHRGENSLARRGGAAAALAGVAAGVIMSGIEAWPSIMAICIRNTAVIMPAAYLQLAYQPWRILYGEKLSPVQPKYHPLIITYKYRK